MASEINLSAEDLARIRSQFSSLDQNGDGILTVAEMRKSLSAAGQDYTVKDVQRMVKKADKNGDGQVEWEEFCHLMADYIQTEAAREESKIVEGKEATDEEYDVAMQAFKMFDINGDGMIDIEELKGAMKELDLEQDPDKVEQLLKELDKDGNGVIDYVEFGRLLGI